MRNNILWYEKKDINKIKTKIKKFVYIVYMLKYSVHVYIFCFKYNNNNNNNNKKETNKQTNKIKYMGSMYCRKIGHMFNTSRDSIVSSDNEIGSQFYPFNFYFNGS